MRQIGIGAAVLIAALLLYRAGWPSAAVASFDECVKAGNPVMESYPRQCRSASGKVFKEDIGNELEKDDLIRIAAPRPNALIASPLTVKGAARGAWYFEAVFPVRLLDESGKEMAHGQARAQGNWTTSGFIPFQAALEFAAPSNGSGTLVLEKDNPSGRPEGADELRIPVKFR